MYGPAKGDIKIMHLCPGLNSATKFTKLTIFHDGLASSSNEVPLEQLD